MNIGTAGWSIPTATAGAFPTAGSHLERYAQVFTAVEINSSFHRPHRRSTYERWAASVPAAFRFSVKMPKTISHDARLVDVGDLLDAFVVQVSGLGDKLAVLLLQLLPSFAYDQALATNFFDTLRPQLSDIVQLACEPRHASWFTDDANACLVAYRVARVMADPVLVPGGDRPGGWTGLHYHRLHGSPRVYYSPYDRLRLEALAEIPHANAPSTWCIFDNTASGAATGDALTLKDIIASR